MEVKRGVWLFVAFLLALLAVSVPALYALEGVSLSGDAFDDLCSAANAANPDIPSRGCVKLVARGLKPGIASTILDKNTGGISFTRDYTLPSDGHLNEWGIDCTNVQEAGTIVLALDGTLKGTLLLADISLGPEGGVCSFEGSTPKSLPPNSKISYRGDKAVGVYTIQYSQENLKSSFTPPTRVGISPQGVSVTPDSMITISADITGREKLVQAEIVNLKGEVLGTLRLYDDGVHTDGEKGDKTYAGVIDTSGFPAGDYSVNFLIA